MKPLKTALLAATAMLGLAFGLAWSQEGAEKPEKPKPRVKKPAPRKVKPRLAGAHAQMAKVCGLSEEQTEKLIAANKARHEAMKEFNEANGEKMKALRKELNELYAKRRKIDADGQTAVMAVLTDEQKATWRQYMVMRTVKAKFGRAKLTEDQLEKIKAEYVKAAVGVDMSKERDRRNLTFKLVRYVQKEVLTDAQRLELSKPPEPRKPAKKKPRPTKPKAMPAVEK